MSTDVAVPATGLTAQVARMIRARLGEEEISRAQLARRLGVDDSWIGKRLKGKTEITLNDLDRIAAALGVSIVDLLPRDRREVTCPYPAQSPVSRPVDNRPPSTHRPPSGPGRTARLRPERTRFAA